jgi:hypothetical protein
VLSDQSAAEHTNVQVATSSRYLQLSARFQRTTGRPGKTNATASKDSDHPFEVLSSSVRTKPGDDKAVKKPLRLGSRSHHGWIRKSREPTTILRLALGGVDWADRDVEALRCPIMTEWQEAGRPPTVAEAREYLEAHMNGGGDPDTIDACDRVLNASQYPAGSLPGPGGTGAKPSPFAKPPEDQLEEEGSD